jgi:hypothetical protein
MTANTAPIPGAGLRRSPNFTESADVLLRRQPEGPAPGPLYAEPQGEASAGGAI